jgi:hypothetical protein
MVSIWQKVVVEEDDFGAQEPDDYSRSEASLSPEQIKQRLGAFLQLHPALQHIIRYRSDMPWRTVIYRLLQELHCVGTPLTGHSTHASLSDWIDACNAHDWVHFEMACVQAIDKHWGKALHKEKLQKQIEHEEFLKSHEAAGSW